ncbi:NAD(P)H-binding protein [Algoriphagus aestuarii]|nr:NAD(P)H-binding protein [Algoriphagus aestuarii]
MKSIQKIAVIGGTGKSGTYLVKELLRQDYHVNLLVRNPEKVSGPSPNLTVIRGNVLVETDVQKLLKDCNAVVSTLGLGTPPSAPDLFEKASSIVLKTMKTFGIKRYILTTGLNVNTPWDQKSEKNLQATTWMEQTFPISTHSKQKEYELLTTSDVSWTLLRLPLIELTDEKCPIGTDLKDCKGGKISAAALAVFLAVQIQSDHLIHQAPFVFNL